MKRQQPRPRFDSSMETKLRGVGTATTSTSPYGEGSDVIDTTKLFSSADTGSAARLGVALGTAFPSGVVVGADGILVFSSSHQDTTSA